MNRLYNDTSEDSFCARFRQSENYDSVSFNQCSVIFIKRLAIYISTEDMSVADESDHIPAKPLKIASFLEGPCHTTRRIKIIFVALIFITSIWLVRAAWLSLAVQRVRVPQQNIVSLFV